MNSPTARNNRNVVSTVTLADGRTMAFQHRDSLGGWVNGLARRGVSPSEVVDSMRGLPETDRVPR